MQKYDVAIIGGGASGLACAVKLKEGAKDLSVVIVDAAERLGKKLAATGNGQGNLGNADMGGGHFHGSVAPLACALAAKYNHLKLFDCLFTTEKNGRIYPSGKQASSLSDCLIRKARAAGVEIIYSEKVTSLSKGFNLTLSSGKKLTASKVVLAAGGCAQKQFCTDGNAYNLIKPFGHTVTHTYPSLVQLKCDTRHIKTLKGIRVECGVTAYDSNRKELARTVGDVIFTDYGVSGNAIFYISAYCAGVNGATLSLEFLPDLSVESIQADIERKIAAGYEESELLCGTLHNQLGRAIIRRTQEKNAASIAQTVKNFTLSVTGSLGFDYAQVTKGGVPLSEVDGNLQSKLVKDLYLTGEILDVDGDCGGYNLTWAFVSGMHVAAAICGDAL